MMRPTVSSGRDGVRLGGGRGATRRRVVLWGLWKLRRSAQGSPRSNQLRVRRSLAGTLSWSRSKAESRCVARVLVSSPSTAQPLDSLARCVAHVATLPLQLRSCPGLEQRATREGRREEGVTCRCHERLDSKSSVNFPCPTIGNWIR
jgi:hypothetical protein